MNKKHFKMVLNYDLELQFEQRKQLHTSFLTTSMQLRKKPANSHSAIA